MFETPKKYIENNLEKTNSDFKITEASPMLKQTEFNNHAKHS